MICEIVRDEGFLAQKSAEASFLDMPIAQNLLDTLAVYADSCVGLAANMIGVQKRIIAVIRDFPGNYSDYRNYLDTLPAKSKPGETEKKDTRIRSERPNKMTFKERKEFESLEAELAELNKEKETLEAFFASGEKIDSDEFKRRSQRYSELGPLIDEKEMRWLELSEKQ